MTTATAAESAAATTTIAVAMEMLLGRRRLDFLELLLKILAELFVGEPMSFLTCTVAVRHHFAGGAPAWGEREERTWFVSTDSTIRRRKQHDMYQILNMS